MRYSKLFPKTLRDKPREANNVSTELLYQGGYIRESTAGRYYFMPLGIRAYQKLIDVVRVEMDAAGAQEMLTPVLHPLALWEETNRTSSAGFELMKVRDRRDADFALGGTAEEMFVDVVRRDRLSYRDLPFNLYQFSQKFRDEMRARGGLLRVREFLMKDAYSFDIDEAAFKLEYQKMWDAYLRIFKCLGLEAQVVESDNGYIGGDYCHEFVVESEVGESRYLVTPNGNYAAHEDVAQFVHEAVNPNEAILPLEIVEQPQWVKTMEENEKHYGLPASRFLKNVVYKTREGNIIIATARGDIEVNTVKLAHAVGAVGGLEPADEADLAKLGTKTGYVHSWGYEGVTTVADLSLKTVINFIGGQKKDLTDSRYVNYGRNFTCDIEADIAAAKTGYLAPDGKQRLEERVGIEVGNIFQLGEHYSRLMSATYMDAEDQPQFYYMGCYGLGIGRTLATIIEKHHDDFGIVWPEIVAPYFTHLLVLGNDPEVGKAAKTLYSELQTAGVEVLFDDRSEVSAGVKFKDADLLGMPYRLVMSKKNLEAGQVEVKNRGTGEVSSVAREEIVGWLEKIRNSNLPRRQAGI